ncbi:thymus-specific serine protease-like [Stomoxys calcitrans]|uniref:thymus-specific serine protease-like n=1 Tax=Stomoxys calcitrans TaxID=35570 RepID=UPI0027E236D5|nr:thymus-specific serine protease-like [Stomoxys calcitrans]
MTEDPGEALIQYIKEIFLPNPQEEEEDKLHGDEWCLDLSYEAMASIYSEYADIYSGTRCWFYQTCHEFGWFATTKASGNASSQLSFAGQVPLKFFQKLCHDVFHSPSNGDGSRVGGSDLGLFSPLLNELHISAKKINHIFGGFANVSQRVIFTHGLLDPWRAVGVHRGQNVLLLKGYSHVEDLGSINLKDTVEMNVAKLKVAAFINKALRN